jgi:aminoglycoside phosphotransferase (APT) family kinase protein
VTGRRLPHGYTNQSWIEDTWVVKQYDGVDGEQRLATEIAALARAASAVPVPEVVQVDAHRRRAVLTFMTGRHGQELVDEGFASQVLSAAGRTLRQFHDEVDGMVHGDYGPQNLLIDTSSWEVSAVLDWEFAHDGEPVEDLAWAEWIVRMHHRGAAPAVSALFEGYGWCPAWPVRQAAMRAKCVKLERLCRRRGQEDAGDMWRSRGQATRAWSE